MAAVAMKKPGKQAASDFCKCAALYFAVLTLAYGMTGHALAGVGSTSAFFVCIALWAGLSEKGEP